MAAALEDGRSLEDSVSRSVVILKNALGEASRKVRKMLEAGGKAALIRPPQKGCQQCPLQ